MPPKPSSTLLYFCSLHLSPSGLVLRDCTLHEKPDGSRWVGLPGKPQIDAEGRHRKDATTGKALYTPIVEIAGKEERQRFQQAALAAIDKLLGRGAAP